MKKYIIISFILSSLSLKSTANYLNYHNFESIIELTSINVEIEKTQIKKDGKVIGRFVFTKKIINPASKNCSEEYQVEIFNKMDQLVANYMITICKGNKRDTKRILNAHMQTAKDKVLHNSANFINYAITLAPKEDQVPQFENVVEYLLSYKYL